MKKTKKNVKNWKEYQKIHQFNSLFFWLDPKEPKSQAYQNDLLKRRNISVIYPNSQTQFAVAFQDARLLCSNMGALPFIYPGFSQNIFKGDSIDVKSILFYMLS